MDTVQYSCDYYDLLGLHPDFADSDLQSAYRRAANMYHPDRNKSEHAGDIMGRINEAYVVLGDSQQRREYHAAWLRGERGTRNSPFGSERSWNAGNGAAEGVWDSAHDQSGWAEQSKQTPNSQQAAMQNSLPADCWGLLGLLGLIAVIPDPPFDILEWALLIGIVIWLVRKRR